jgi:putative photosynthetic complex assembly protein
MSDPFRHHPIPRPALWSLAGLVVFSLLAVIVAQAFGYKAGEIPPGQVVEQRDLRFSDGDAGRVYVWDAGQDVLMGSLEPGQENFIRGVLRSFARERRSLGIGDQEPFRLARHADGRLTIEDTSTGRLIDLQAFGPTNSGAFARLLSAEPAGS